MIASLPMHDRPEIRAATDSFWQAIRQALGRGPETLTREGDPWDQWQSPDLLLSQTCGYPYRARLHGKVRIVGTPDFGLDGCGPGEYRSVFVARKDDPRSDPAEFSAARFAYNEPMSQSGWAAPGAYAEARGFAFADTRRTGSHQVSAHAVAEGQADLAALDAQSWQLMQRYDSFADKLHVIAATPPTPALPFITANGQDADAIFTALQTAVEVLPSETRDALDLRGIVRLPPAAYLAVQTPAPPPA
ncbi:ABC transporter, phosphonate, periplasmic substrate-binding protein [Roseovarius sp. THAF9]|uniref:phosphate/phosphite/phosphonate ABC transporter substrate-binding protein n=1 Tax=Roseovarius sp. THAF9 TaxID=2587847 RepID=UPI001267ED24|nr:PhnD/SsuA/transferrin family substrate-binding protein [Roseovarius sp. THAF9]QFT92591.1 ABC transporter, phosphonate, periplasmic substrate-binding protein [Roseovarius sp. THAF9]